MMPKIGVEEVVTAIGTDQFGDRLVEWFEENYPDLSCCELEDKYAEDVEYSSGVELIEESRGMVSAKIAINYRECTPTDCCDIARIAQVEAEIGVTIYPESLSIEVDGFLSWHDQHADGDYY